MRYLLSTFVSIGLLFAFLLIPIHLINSLLLIPGYISILETVAIILLCWWFSTSIYNYFFTRNFDVKWHSLKGLEQTRNAFVIFMQDMLHKQELQIRQIGILDDDRPIAITYGTCKKDIHLIISKGVFANLKEKEIEAMIAHEIAHMRFGDFPILATAYLPAFICYQPVMAFWRNTSASKPFAIIGFLFYLLWRFFTLSVLLQSRIREYFADELAATLTHPNMLGMALTKTSLIYISAGERRKSDNLMEVARPFAFIDYKMARNLALAYLNQKITGSWILVEHLIIQDLYNPWSVLFEAISTHPLPGKRILLIGLKAKQLQIEPFIDLQRMFAQETEEAALKLNFLEDFIVFAIARFSPLLIAFLLLAGYFYSIPTTIGVIVLLYGLGIALLSLYTFSYINFEDGVIKSELEDAHISPLRGRPLNLNGVIRGKSSLGLDLPEELLFADHSGQIFIGPRSLLPLVISPYISADSLMKMKDKRVKVKGWYLRDRYPKIIIDEVQDEQNYLKGRQRMFDLGVASLVVSVGLILIMI